MTAVWNEFTGKPVQLAPSLRLGSVRLSGGEKTPGVTKEEEEEAEFHVISY